MPNYGKRAADIDQDFYDRQRVKAACTCGKRSRGLLSVAEARQWHEEHRAEYHPERPDQAAWLRAFDRKRRSGHVNTRQLTHGHRRAKQTDEELERRDTLRFRPGV